MTDLLTTRQVQDILKVDRITIYRMLQDGRLKGVKIGQQWRFPQHEIDRLLGMVPPLDEPSMPESAAALPVHCIQTIQDLFSEVARISSVLMDMNGDLVTRISHPGRYYTLLTSTTAGQEISRSSFKEMAALASQGQSRFTCKFGLDYIGAPILEKGIQIGVFLIGQFFWQPRKNGDWTLHVENLARSCQLPPQDLTAAAAETPVIPVEQHTIVQKWPYSAALAVQSILQERVNFIDRLQQIASLTNLA